MPNERDLDAAGQDPQTELAYTGVSVPFHARRPRKKKRATGNIIDLNNRAPTCTLVLFGKRKAEPSKRTEVFACYADASAAAQEAMKDDRWHHAEITFGRKLNISHRNFAGYGVWRWTRRPRARNSENRTSTSCPQEASGSARLPVHPSVRLARQSKSVVLTDERGAVVKSLFEKTPCTDSAHGMSERGEPNPDADE